MHPNDVPPRKSGGGPKIPPEYWEHIRKHWEEDDDHPNPGEAARRAAKEHGFKAPTYRAVQYHIEHDKWQRVSNLEGIVGAAQRKADAMVEVDGVATVPPDEATPKTRRAEAEDKRAMVLSRHRREWRRVSSLRDDAVAAWQEALAEFKTLPIESRIKQSVQMAQFSKTIAETTKIQQDGERKAWGLDDVPSLPDFSKMSDAELRAFVAAIK